MIWVLHSDIILGDLASNIWRNNACKISYIRKERRAKITERWRNGDWMVTKWHWMVTEMHLPFSRLNGDWKVTEWRLSVFTEWWRFVLCSLLHSQRSVRCVNYKMTEVNGQLLFQRAPDKDSIKTLNKWLEAFHIFWKPPEEISNLICYAQIERSLVVMSLP